MFYADAKLSDLETKEAALSKKANDPKTPQGEVRDIQNQLHEIRRHMNRKREQEFQTKMETHVSGSDDYIGASAGNYSFYYGYETSECPVKSHRNEEICDDKGCDKREWCFTVDYKGKEIYRWRESEISIGDRNIEDVMILGMARFIKEELNSGTQAHMESLQSES